MGVDLLAVVELLFPPLVGVEERTDLLAVVEVRPLPWQCCRQ